MFSEDTIERAEWYAKNVLRSLEQRLMREEQELETGAIGGIGNDDLAKVILGTKRSIEVWRYINISLIRTTLDNENVTNKN